MRYDSMELPLPLQLPVKVRLRVETMTSVGSFRRIGQQYVPYSLPLREVVGAGGVVGSSELTAPFDHKSKDRSRNVRVSSGLFPVLIWPCTYEGAHS